MYDHRGGNLGLHFYGKFFRWNANASSASSTASTSTFFRRHPSAPATASSAIFGRHAYANTFG